MHAGSQPKHLRLFAYFSFDNVLGYIKKVILMLRRGVSIYSFLHLLKNTSKTWMRMICYNAILAANVFII